MNSTEPLNDISSDNREDLNKPDDLERVVAKAIDFIIVVALLEIVPKVGYFAGLAYLLIADGLFEGRSVGKMLIGIKVVFNNATDTAAGCGFKGSIFRNLPFAAGYILYGILNGIPIIGWLLSLAVITLVPAFEFLVMTGSETGMRLGDEIAKTRVVEDKQGGLNVS
ncbi:MAG TPA: hypothetical protein ENH45_00005 [Nitrospirae bacterium]|nr:RDD family protein [bacterium BMS3Abin09]GBE40203.1 RDD family protein [bacterium BMS3Bbin09]HDN94694.1 hypothetical protein [Nitrospirota bacterium]HDZ83576.1 hypothetical protein [Nitrospirota bacterium]